MRPTKGPEARVQVPICNTKGWAPFSELQICTNLKQKDRVTVVTQGTLVRWHKLLLSFNYHQITVAFTGALRRIAAP